MITEPSQVCDHVNLRSGQRCVTRSSSAVTILASPNTLTRSVAKPSRPYVAPGQFGAGCVQVQVGE